MNRDDAQSGIEHFGRLLALAENLHQRQIAIYSHEWLCMVFGSWSLVAGTRHRSYFFSWDGREGFISIQGPIHVADLNPGASPAVANERLGFGPDIDPLNYVLRFFETGRHAN